MAEQFKYDDLPHSPGTFANYTVLSEGPNGIINSAYDTLNNSVVIIKDLIIPYNNKELFMNEIQVMMYLNQFNHPNIVKLIHAFKSSGFVGNLPQMRAHMVMEYYPFVLRALINSPEADFSLPNIKCIMKQLLSAVNHMHENNIFHRDLKPDNIFITNSGILKVGDFGLSNFIKKRPDGRYEDNERNVITIWYRPPELLLGETSYGPEVDIWSLGCILAELFTGYAILQGNDDYAQLLCISTLCGELVPEMWPGVENLSQYYQFFDRLRYHCLGKRNVKTRLSVEFSNELGRDLVSLMIVPNPARRLTAAQALQHSLFTTVPFPYSIINIPRIKYHRF